MKKKIKEFEKREAKLEVEKLKLERQSKSKMVENKSNQTDTHLTTASSSTCSSKPVIDDNANEIEKFSHIPLIPTKNQFHILDQTCSNENPISTQSLEPSSKLVTTSHMAKDCSLETINSLHPSSINLPVTSSLNTTTSSPVASSSSLAQYTEEREMLKAMMKLVNDMTK